MNGSWAKPKPTSNFAIWKSAPSAPEQGVPASQVVWMICLVRENLWDYLQKHAELEKPAEIFGEIALLEMLDQFFNRAIFYATLGHERARNGDQVFQEPASV